MNALVADANVLSVAAIEGKLATRADASKHQGDFRKIVQGVNDTLDAVIGPLNNIKEVIEGLGRNDMSVSLKGEYRGDFLALKEAFERALEEVNSTLHEIVDAVEQVGQSSEQLRAASQNMASTSEEQSSSVEEVTSSLEETDTQVKANTDAANTANQLVMGTSQAASSGQGQGLGRGDRHRQRGAGPRQINIAMNQVAAQSLLPAAIVRRMIPLQAAVRLALESFTSRIEKAYQAEAQLGSQLERLQEEAIAVRARPATLLTKPLEAFAETIARENGREIDLIISGEDLVLDHAMLEELKPHLRTLIAFCAAQSIEQPGHRVSMGKGRRGKIRVALVRSDERVLATLDDDGAGLKAVPEGKADALFAEIRTALRSRGGGLRIESPADGGIRFHVSLPMAMVVLDGMVVRVAGFRYVIPLEAIQRIVHSSVDDVMRVSAEGR